MASDPDFSYGSHLRLDQVLGAVAPVSESHDEILFIIQHQTSELWFRLVLAEIDIARQSLEGDDPRAALKALRRVAVVMRHLVESWEVLRQLEPRDFLSFRGDLGTASGFQSWQYRLVEFALGNRDMAMLQAHQDHPERMALFEAELARPSLYQSLLRRLSQTLETDFPKETFAKDRPYRAQAAVLDAWKQVYAPNAPYPALHDLAEQLVEIEDRFRCWRFNHVTTVERVIGTRRGTGGTSGVGYLRRMLEVEHFPELWSLRADL